MTTPTPPPFKPRLHALIPCAGIGERAGRVGRKQYAPLAASTVVGHTLAALNLVSRLAMTLVVISPDDEEFEHAVPQFHGAVARVGGATRAQTVAAGLAELARLGADDRDWVLVHDAARCLIRAEWVDALIDDCIEDEVGGLLALPVPDTLKLERDGRVDQTIDRRGKWQAQTPQMFRLGALRDALSKALTATGFDITDEAGAMQANGQSPRLVLGSLENFKVTYPMDFQLAERLLATRQ